MSEQPLKRRSYPSYPIGRSLILATVESRSEELFELLLSRDLNFINTDLGHLGSAITASILYQADIDYVLFLLSKGADPNIGNGVGIQLSQSLPGTHLSGSSRC